MTEPVGSAALVDWELAVAAGVRLVRPGPQLPREQARAAVSQLRDLAVEARSHVRTYTRLDAPAADAPVAVVDRTEWLRSNAEGIRHLLDPIAHRLVRGGVPGPLRAVGARVTALEVGGGLAWMSSKVLGQYEMFPPGGPDGDRPGRLLLVAPNIVQVEQELDVDPDDFRMWVCLHEETHRVQFAAVPWLRGHLVEGISSLMGSIETDPAAVAERLRAAAAAVASAARGIDGPSLAEAVQTPEQRAQLDRLTAVMALLEGHADVVMDGVGPSVVPTVEQIRTAFQRRREHPGRAELAIRRLVGLDAKMRQYRDGAAFVRGVVDRVGMDGFNRVWASPAALPSAEEILDPQSWVDRLHGPALG
jgi:coenzyme F420 biosynthesis associated uncharacterized protein